MEARTGAGGILVYPDRGVGQGISCIPCPLKTLSLDSELAVLNSHFVSLVFVKCRALHTLYRKGYTGNAHVVGNSPVRYAKIGE